jgi:hypothetical protein
MKMSLKTLKFLAIAASSMLMAGNAHANVALTLSDGDSTPTSRVVVPGSTFTLTANLTSTTESITGVDYYLQAAGSGSGLFRITDRNIGSSPFSDLIKANTGDNGANAGILDATMSLLSPRNTLDLGASIANVNLPVTPGTYALATYTISVPSNISPGSYVISTTSDNGTGWVAQAPLFNESTFNQYGSFTVTVSQPISPVPEPSAGLAIAGVIALLSRRR